MNNERNQCIKAREIDTMSQSRKKRKRREKTVKRQKLKPKLNKTVKAIRKHEIRYKIKQETESGKQDETRTNEIENKPNKKHTIRMLVKI